jgi:hypothetical protein
MNDRPETFGLANPVRFGFGGQKLWRSGALKPVIAVIEPPPSDIRPLPSAL